MLRYRYSATGEDDMNHNLFDDFESHSGSLPDGDGRDEADESSRKAMKKGKVVD